MCPSLHECSLCISNFLEDFSSLSHSMHCWAVSFKTNLKSIDWVLGAPDTLGAVVGHVDVVECNGQEHGHWDKNIKLQVLCHVIEVCDLEQFALLL